MNTERLEMLAKNERGNICPFCGAYSVRNCEMAEETGGICPWEESEPDPDLLRDMRDDEPVQHKE